jgi:hypothetical protein
MVWDNPGLAVCGFELPSNIPIYYQSIRPPRRAYSNWPLLLLLFFNPCPHLLLAQLVLCADGFGLWLANKSPPFSTLFLTLLDSNNPDPSNSPQPSPSTCSLILTLYSLNWCSVLMGLAYISIAASVIEPYNNPPFYFLFLASGTTIPASPSTGSAMGSAPDYYPLYYPPSNFVCVRWNLNPTASAESLSSNLSLSYTSKFPDIESYSLIYYTKYLL